MTKRLFTIEVDADHPEPESAVSAALEIIRGLGSVSIREEFSNV